MRFWLYSLLVLMCALFLHYQMDIREYIKVKTVPGGQPGDSKYYAGIAFSKNIVHKHMRSDIKYANYLERLAL